MATEKLNITGWNGGSPAAWAGFVTNVDEAISVADGQTVASLLRNNTVTFDLSNVSTFTDLDEVTDVTITLRGHKSNASYAAQFVVALLVNGVSQGLTVSSDLSTSFTNIVITNAGWNSTWTQQELNSMQVYVRVQDDAPELDLPQVWSIDCIDVDVTYTPGLITKGPGAAALTLAPQTPLRVPAGDHVAKRAGVGGLALNSEPPVASRGTVWSVPVGDATLTGFPAYLNSIRTQLQINSWDNGWPSGFVTNVDEPTLTADNQTVSTTIDNDVVVFGLDDVTGTIVATDEVLAVVMTLRASSEGGGYVGTQLVINGVTKDPVYTVLSDTMANYPLTDSSWDDNWSVAQLNAMQVRVTAYDAGGLPIAIDSIDVIVEYVNQSPIQRAPAEIARTLTGKAPTLRYLRNVPVNNDALSFTGKTASLLRADTVYPDEVQRIFVPNLPQRVVDFIPQPAAGAVTVSEKTGVRVVNRITQPSAETASFTGKIPVADRVENREVLPLRRQLNLVEHSPLPARSNNPAFNPAEAQIVYAGKAPTSAPTTNVWRTPAAATLTTTGLGVSIDSYIRSPAAATATLVGKLPALSRKRTVVPNEDALAIAGKVPELRFSNNPVAEPLAGGLNLVVFRGLLLFSYPPTTVLIDNRSAAPAVTSLSLTPENPAAQTTNAVTESPLRVRRTLMGKSVSVVQTFSTESAKATLTLAGKVPVSARADTIAVAAAGLALSAKELNVEALDARVPGTGALTLSSAGAPSLVFTTSLTPGLPGLVSITPDYAVEFIATPTIILID